MPEIKVKLLNGKLHTVDIDLKSTTLSLKQQLASEAPVAQQRIFFAGKCLEDGIRLCDYGVEKESTVYLMLRPEQVSKKRPREEETSATCTPDPERLQALLDCYEISIAEAADLEPLRQYDIIFILDDSGSMNTADTPGGPTRWQELKQTATTMLEFATYFDPDGTDLYFLNRSPVESVSNPEDRRVRECFQKPPSGRTPLTEKVQEVVAERRDGDRPLLLVIATDGEPNGGSSKFKSALERIIADPKKNVRFQIMACTDDESSIAWLNDFDDKFSEVDVCDDFQSERKEVLQAGKVSRFTRADWVMKALLGPISSKFDDWDQISGRTKSQKHNSGQSLMKYVCPAAVVLIVAFVLACAMEH